MKDGSNYAMGWESFKGDTPKVTAFGTLKSLVQSTPKKIDLMSGMNYIYVIVPDSDWILTKLVYWNPINTKWEKF